MNSSPVAFALALVLFTAAVSNRARAHVRVSPSVVNAGHEATLVFRCPNERSNTSTTRLVVQLPRNVIIPVLRVPPPRCWVSRVTMRTLAKRLAHDLLREVVDTITWSGGHINPGQRQDFEVVAGPMPFAPAKLVFKAVQTYSNGEVVRWIQVRDAGEDVPQFPAPTLEVV